MPVTRMLLLSRMCNFMSVPMLRTFVGMISVDFTTVVGFQLRQIWRLSLSLLLAWSLGQFDIQHWFNV